MPRKPTVQPEPTEVIFTDNFVIQIRDKDTREIGRGKDKAFESSELHSQVLLGLVDMLLSEVKSKRIEALGYLEGHRATSKLARYLQLCGYEQADRALRRHASEIRRKWRNYRDAMTTEQRARILNPDR